MGRCRLLICVAAALLACSCSTGPPREVSPASRFEATISRLERADPGSPAPLNVQLAYAAYLLSGASGSSCGKPLTLAQEQIGSVAANPKARVMFPGGWPLVADLEYRQHLARADCLGKADRRDELLAAVEAARRAITLYRDQFDYHSAVVMQFDAASTLHQLGDDAGAIAALEAALRMDREYGFRDDAGQNYEALLTWRGEPAGAGEIANLMRDFPQRRVTFKFAWHPADAQIMLERRRVCLTDGDITHSRASAAFEDHIAAGQDGGWMVSYTHRLSAYEPGVWPIERDAKSQHLAFPPAPLPVLDFKISATGGFDGVTDAKSFSARLNARTVALIRGGRPPGIDAASITKDAVDEANTDLSPGILEAETAQNYQLETAMWIGATLEQGVWYQMSAALLLPGGQRYAVPQQIEFAFTRMVACTAGDATKDCVEIVIHATPDETTIKNLFADLAGGSPEYPYMGYAAATDARIVVDPVTLLPYSREERIYWYASTSWHSADKFLQEEHLFSTTRYALAATPAAAQAH